MLVFEIIRLTEQQRQFTGRAASQVQHFARLICRGRDIAQTGSDMLHRQRHAPPDTRSQSMREIGMDDRVIQRRRDDVFMAVISIQHDPIIAGIAQRLIPRPLPNRRTHKMRAQHVFGMPFHRPKPRVTARNRQHNIIELVPNLLKLRTTFLKQATGRMMPRHRVERPPCWLQRLGFGPH